MATRAATSPIRAEDQLLVITKGGKAGSDGGIKLSGVRPLSLKPSNQACHALFEGLFVLLGD
jgi:hypothetical protein